MLATKGIETRWFVMRFGIERFSKLAFGFFQFYEVCIDAKIASDQCHAFLYTDLLKYFS
jgi:hypothetical protein